MFQNQLKVGINHMLRWLCESTYSITCSQRSRCSTHWGTHLHKKQHSNWFCWINCYKPIFGPSIQVSQIRVNTIHGISNYCSVQDKKVMCHPGIGRWCSEVCLKCCLYKPGMDPRHYLAEPKH